MNPQLYAPPFAGGLFVGMLAKVESGRRFGLRLDLLAPNAKVAMREQFRRYLDARLEVYRKLPDVAAPESQFDAATKMEGEIWERADSAARESNNPQVAMLLSPAVNQVIDLANSELMVTRRLGLIHIDEVNQNLVELRQSMTPKN